IEKALDAELHGTPGRARLLTDVKRRGIDSRLASEARAGTSITLTIDERLQFVAERELAAAVASHHAVSGSLVVMNPHNGEIGAIQVGLKVGQANMHEYMRRFGFGQKTGIALPAESPGKVRKLSRWGSTSLASVAMGQEVSVTTLQLAQAASVIANGGLLVKPR